MYNRFIFMFFLFVFVSYVSAEESNLAQELFLNSSEMITLNSASRHIDVIDSRDESGMALQMPEKSKGKAFLLSLLIPGAGERYVGSIKKSNIFIATEISLWLSYTGFVKYRDWRKDDYKTYAASYAGVELSGKTDSYFVDLGNYDSIYEYNSAKLRQRNLPEYYRDTETYYWNWNTDAQRDQFEQLRISSDRANNRATFVIGAIFANHIFSAIDAIWSVYKYDKSQVSALDWDMQFGDGYIQPQINLTLTANF